MNMGRALMPEPTPVFDAPDGQARSSPIWAAFLLLWGFWLIANMATMPVVFWVLSPALLAGEAAKPQSMGLVILLSLYVMFTVFGACVLIWLKKYERRSLTSAGVVWADAWRRYVRGLVRGAGFALALLGIGAVFAVLAHEPAEASGPFSWDVFSHPMTLLVFAALIFGLLLQSAAEELICRGWLMSTLAMRYGRVFALFASSVFFGSLHVHFLFAGNVLAGVVAISAITLMGVMLGVYALAERSIIGAAGLHGAFNALVFAGALAVMLGTGQGIDPLAALNAAYEQSTQPNELGLESFVQGALAALVAIILWRRMTRRST